MRKRICKICGKEFDAIGRALYCSVECKRAMAREQVSASHNRANKSLRQGVYLAILQELGRYDNIDKQVECLEKYCLLHKEAYNLIKGE